MQATDLRNEALKADIRKMQDGSFALAQGKGKGDTKGKGKSKTKGGKDKGKGKTKTKGPPKKESPGGKDSKGKAKGEKTQGKTACYDRKKVCLDYLKKECNKGAACPKHHNPPCPALCRGEKCDFGEKCLFPHWNVPQTNVKAATGKQKPEAKAKAAAKTEGTSP